MCHNFIATVAPKQPWIHFSGWWYIWRGQFSTNYRLLSAVPIMIIPMQNERIIFKNIRYLQFPEKWNHIKEDLLALRRFKIIGMKVMSSTERVNFSNTIFLSWRWFTFCPVLLIFVRPFVHSFTFFSSPVFLWKESFVRSFRCQPLFVRYVKSQIYAKCTKSNWKP